MKMKRKIRPSKKYSAWLSSSPLKKASIFIALFLAVGATIVFVKASTPVDNNFITSISEVGRISQPPNYSGRDGGDSALVGDRVTWIFGDTLYAPNIPVTGDLFRSATAAIGSITNPTQVTEPLDAHNAPNQLIPHTAEEQAYNIAHRSGADRYALWPSTIIPKSDGKTAWVFFNDLLISGGKWITQGTGIALLGANSTLATRQAGFIFTASEVPFRKAIVVGEMAYVYSGESGQKYCKVSRVPRDQANSRAAYQFWDGNSWQSDINKAKAIIPCSNMGYAVMYNRTLKSYVEALIPNYSKAVYFSYAAAPEGPWSTPIKGFDLPLDDPKNTPYVPNFHSELSTDNDKTVYLTYSGSTTTVRLMKITLQAPDSGQKASDLAAASYGLSQAAPTPKASPKQKAPSTSSSTPTTTQKTPITSSTEDPESKSVAPSRAPDSKLSWWQRVNLYLRRHWNALMDKLIN